MKYIFFHFYACFPSRCKIFFSRFFNLVAVLIFICLTCFFVLKISFPFEKRISKIETLRLAASYIELLMDTLNQGDRPSDYLTRCANGDVTDPKRWKTTDLTTRLQWIKWD